MSICFIIICHQKINDFVQNLSISSASALEILQFFAKPLILEYNQVIFNMVHVHVKTKNSVCMKNILDH